MRFLVIFPITIIAIIVAISLYLQPHDLDSCNEQVGTTAPCLPVDAIVAVSGGDTNARTDEAIRVYKNGWSKTLIFSGAALDKSGPSNAAVMQARAISQGVPASAILIDELSETTKQNAENTKNIFDAHNIKTIILVTSGYHQKRASLEFNKRAPGVTTYNHPVDTDQDWSFWWWTSPHGWTLAITELFKIVLFYFGVSQ
ncbi:YdcF family protein [Patescibacteria group bacterium]|nr:MAG: YdcF family protein [Patescibacteria group bacterium]